MALACLSIHAEGGIGELVVDGLHALDGERAGVFDLLLADFAEVRIDGGVVGVGGPGVHDPARAELFLELGGLRVVGILRLFLGVEVIEVAEELVEAVDRRQELVQVAQVVLAELSGGVAEVLHEVGDARVFGLQADVRARQADFGQPGADGRLPGDERRAPGGAALLPVPVGEPRAFVGDAVDVGRAVAHDPAVVATRVKPPDVVAP